MSFSGLLCSVIRQMKHWCWCNSVMFSVSVCSLNVDQLRSSFVCDLVPCCWVFGVWHFETACRYHSPTNITLYYCKWKISYYFLNDLFSFSQNLSFSILYTYLVVIIQSTCSADITSRISLFLVISWLVLLVSSPPCWYDMIYMFTAIGLSPSGSSAVHIYTQKLHSTINFGRVQAVRYLLRVFSSHFLPPIPPWCPDASSTFLCVFILWFYFKLYISE